MTDKPASVDDIVAFACEAVRITRAMAEADLGLSDRFYNPPEAVYEPEAKGQTSRIYYMHSTPDKYGFEIIRSSRDDWDKPVAVQFNLRPFFDNPEPVWNRDPPLGLSRDSTLADLAARFGPPTASGKGECLEWWGCDSFAWRFAPFLWLSIHMSKGQMVIVEYGEPVGTIIPENDGGPAS